MYPYVYVIISYIVPQYCYIYIYIYIYICIYIYTYHIGYTLDMYY